MARLLRSPLESPERWLSCDESDAKNRGGGGDPNRENEMITSYGMIHDEDVPLRCSKNEILRGEGEQKTNFCVYL